jgi:hypothetical protein
MDISTNAGVAFHAAGRHGLTRMPAFANLAAVTYFHRTKPDVSGRLLRASVSSLSSFATKDDSYDESQEEGRRSSPTLPLVQSRQPAHHDPRTSHIRLTSAVNADFPYRRTHAIVYGQLVTVLLPTGSRGSNDGVIASSRTTCTGATVVAVGARPLLHTAQGFPFDLRRSRFEAGRVSGAPLESP